MAIFPGRRLWPYEILSSVGAGGMGEVEAFWPAIMLGGSRQPKSPAVRGISC
jgi:hypothetical protein